MKLVKLTIKTPKLMTTFLLVIALFYPMLLSATSNDFDPFEKTIKEINQALDNHQITSEQLVQFYLERIKAYDKKGPMINSIITLNSRVLEQARLLDKERITKGPRSILHGIPIILKDNHDTADLFNSAGSRTLQGITPPDDAFVVARLRKAGALFLGKANMSEFALSYGRLGYSSLGGLTLNPYNLKRDASGSSSGSAASIAANFAVAATGTDTAGSIRGPAAVCGLVGIKPTLGLTSRNGIIPASLSFDVVGPIARTVEDAAILLGFMAGPDSADALTKMCEGQFYRDYQPFLKERALKKARLGIVRTFLGANKEVDTIFDKTLSIMRIQGVELIEVTLPESLTSLWPLMEPVVLAEFGPQIEAYLATLPPGSPRVLSDLIQLSESPAFIESPTPVNPAGIKGLKSALASKGLDSTRLLHILSYVIPQARCSLKKLLRDNQLDALIFPTITCPASPIFTIKDDPGYICDIDDPYRPGYPASFTGFPEITVPAGKTSDGLPVGVSFLGDAFSESRLLGLAYAFEKAAHARQLPDHTPPLPKQIKNSEYQKKQNKIKITASEGGGSEGSEENRKTPDGEKKTLKPELTFGGALWVNYAFQKWKSLDQGRKKDLRFDNLRLSIDGNYGKFLFSGQYRLYGYTRAIHHAWIGYQPTENNQIELGVTQVPFGLLPFATHSFWFGLGYYVGLEDDYDAGLKYRHKAGPWEFHFAFFRNEEYGDATSLDRYSVDPVRIDDQQNEETNQFNIRLAHTIKHRGDRRTELGLSGEWGSLLNRTTGGFGDHWAVAFHYNGWYNNWNPQIQVAHYRYNPKNPHDISNLLILMGNLTSFREIAAEGTLLNLNLARFFNVHWGPFERFRLYYNYSHLFKSEITFKDSQLHNLGSVLQAGPFWIWIDLLLGKNAWYLNDSPEGSGLGSGGTDQWHYRFNVNFEWYF